jgi:hypothetical protein
MIVCSNSCIDPLTDENNCGSCGNVCSGVCVAGGCSAPGCPSGQIDCGGSCIDPLKDRDYCGATEGCVGGTVCGAGEICVSGSCTLNCPPNLTNCSGTCVDTDTDEAYCGSCTHSCASGEVCVAGTCEIGGPVTYEAAVPKTGQTICYNSSGAIISCAGTGQDGDLQKGVPWPNPRFTDNSNGTITDNLTGLIWLKNANCYGTKTWAQALTDCNGLNSGECGLTDGSTEGDWRLPNSNELASLVHKGYYNPAVPNTAGTGKWSAEDPFNNVQSSVYWSSTTYAYDTALACSVIMGIGYVYDDLKTDGYYVWPVRGGQ